MLTRTPPTAHGSQAPTGRPPMPTAPDNQLRRPLRSDARRAGRLGCEAGRERMARRHASPAAMMPTVVRFLHVGIASSGRSRAREPYARSSRFTTAQVELTRPVDELPRRVATFDRASLASDPGLP
jgi:hypothetical protein